MLPANQIRASSSALLRITSEVQESIRLSMMIRFRTQPE
jgi:hypothetical protein